MLVRLLYASRAVGPVTPAIIDAIIGDARAHNLDAGITGILCYGGDVFMQVLEGGRAQVNALYKHIVCDKRHDDVTLLHFEEISERRFASWTAGQVNLAKINPSIVLKYSERAVLDPFAVSGAVSMALLEELLATASIIGRAG